MTDTTVWSATWVDAEERNAFQLTKHDGTILILKRGSWVTLPGRTDKSIIDNIYSGSDTDIGPTGITTLPWREAEQRFATQQWSFIGNPRFIVCYPSGTLKFGIQMNWDEVYLCEPPENID